MHARTTSFDTDIEVVLSAEFDYTGIRLGLECNSHADIRCTDGLDEDDGVRLDCAVEDFGRVCKATQSAQSSDRRTLRHGVPTLGLVYLNRKCPIAV